MHARAVGTHHVERLRSVAVALENDLRSVGRIAWARVDARGLGESPRLARPEVHFINAGAAVRGSKTHDHLLPVGRETRREGHSREIADELATACLEVHDENLRLV